MLSLTDHLMFFLQKKYLMNTILSCSPSFWLTDHLKIFVKEKTTSGQETLQDICQEIYKLQWLSMISNEGFKYIKANVCACIFMECLTTLLSPDIWFLGKAFWSKLFHLLIIVLRVQKSQSNSWLPALHLFSHVLGENTSRKPFHDSCPFKMFLER